MKKENNKVNLYLAHRDRIKDESDAGLVRYFYWEILKKIWWKVLLVALGAPLLFLLIAPIFGDLLSFLIACAAGALAVMIICDKAGEA